MTRTQHAVIRRVSEKELRQAGYTRDFARRFAQALIQEIKKDEVKA